jgi:hypothetical protein
MKFKIGDVVRYSDKPTALFEVVNYFEHGSAIRYYGRHMLGGLIGAYEAECFLASEADLLLWNSKVYYRK